MLAAFPAVSGLWYILLITTGVCFVLTVVHNLTKGNKMDTLKRLGTLKYVNTEMLCVTMIERSQQCTDTQPTRLAGLGLVTHHHFIGFPLATALCSP